MSPGSVEQVRDALAASRARADRVLAEAASEARSLERGVEGRVRAGVGERARRIESLRRTIAEQATAIESAYVELVEGLARTSRRLAEVSRRSDFSPPRWPGGIERAVELKLSETREMTFRLAPHPPLSQRPGEGEPSDSPRGRR